MLMPESFQQVKGHAGAQCNTEPSELQDWMWQPRPNAQLHLSLTKTSKPIKIK